MYFSAFLPYIRVLVLNDWFVDIPQLGVRSSGVSVCMYNNFIILVSGSFLLVKFHVIFIGCSIFYFGFFLSHIWIQSFPMWESQFSISWNNTSKNHVYNLLIYTPFISLHCIFFKSTPKAYIKDTLSKWFKRDSLIAIITVFILNIQLNI